MRALGLLVVVGCYHPAPASDVPCAANFECPTGQLCDVGQNPPVCVTKLVDAGIADTTARDAQPVDARPVDAAAGAPIAFVQQVSDKPVGMSQALAFPAPIGASDAIILCLNFSVANGADLQSISDSLGNTYALVVNGIASSNAVHYVAVALDSPPGVDTVTVTFTGALPSAGSDLMMMEYSGLALANAFDVTNHATGMTTAMSSGTIVTHAANELILGYAEGTGTTAGAGFTQRASQTGNLTEDKIVSAIGQYDATATATSGAWTMIVASFSGR